MRTLLQRSFPEVTIVTNEELRGNEACELARELRAAVSEAIDKMQLRDLTDGPDQEAEMRFWTIPPGKIESGES